MEIFTIFAATCGGVETSLIDCGSGGGVGAILRIVVNVLMVLVSVLAVIGIVVVGIQYLTARDNQAQTVKSRNRLLQIVLGLAIFSGLYAITSFLLPSFEGVDQTVSDIDDSVNYTPPKTESNAFTPPQTNNNNNNSNNTNNSNTTPSTPSTNPSNTPSNTPTDASTLTSADSSLPAGKCWTNKNKVATTDCQTYAVKLESFSTDGLGVQWPFAWYSGTSINPKQGGYYSHHGYIRKKGEEDPSTGIVFCDSVDMTGYEYCYDNRVSGGSGYQSADLYSYFGFPDTVYSTISNGDWGIKLNGNNGYNLRNGTTGVEILPLFYPTSGGKVVYTGSSTYEGGKCGGATFTITNSAGQTAKMTYWHMSGYGLASSISSVSASTHIGYDGHNNYCSQNTSAHLDVELKASNTLLYKMWDIARLASDGSHYSTARGSSSLATAQINAIKVLCTDKSNNHPAACQTAAQNVINPPSSTTTVTKPGKQDDTSNTKNSNPSIREDVK